ncbi:MAG: 1-acyl-sn-glycerol-3-phosphate acyltransferase [Gammaproteobacteria bacterium]|nr:1-acyl-sn-glycerol-3-phosphate acyltransferase [Gammaproteobacteria bacterium]
MEKKQNIVFSLFRSTVFLIGSAITLFIFFPLSLILLLLFVPFQTRFKIISRWGRFNIWWLGVACGVRYEVEGLDNIKAQDVAIIYVKHESTWETYAMQRFFPPHAWILKRSLLLIPLFGWGLASLRPIAIDRSSGHRAVNQIVEGGIKRLESGQWVMVFPEGTRVPNGKMKKFGIGGGVLAEKSGHPVIPVAHNAGAYWPRGSFIKYPGTIKVVIGEPIQTQGKSAADITREAEEWMRQTMERVNGQPIELMARK